MFFVIIYSAIDQGYIGLSLASCHKDEIWDLKAKLGLFWDLLRSLVPIGTKSQIWDLVASTESAKGKRFNLLKMYFHNLIIETTYFAHFRIQALFISLSR